jgi:hypothetical protein
MSKLSFLDSGLGVKLSFFKALKEKVYVVKNTAESRG